MNEHTDKMYPGYRQDSRVLNYRGIKSGAFQRQYPQQDHDAQKSLSRGFPAEQSLTGPQIRHKAAHQKLPIHRRRHPNSHVHRRKEKKNGRCRSRNMTPIQKKSLSPQPFPVRSRLSSSFKRKLQLRLQWQILYRRFLHWPYPGEKYRTYQTDLNEIEILHPGGKYRAVYNQQSNAPWRPARAWTPIMGR